MKYIKELDVVRAFAVIFVILTHWFPQGAFKQYVDLGGTGVDIFFVLSGFLITGILLDNRRSVELGTSTISKGVIIRNFIVRRILRIFPIYYLLIVVLLLFGNVLKSSMKEDVVYYATYIQNFLFYDRQAWPGGKLAHLWSLAVEEQFYLFWPWLMVFVNRKYIKQTILFFIILGFSSNYLFKFFLEKKDLINILTPTCFDGFGIGALMAYYNVNDKPYFQSGKLIRWFSLIAIALLSINLITGNRWVPDRPIVSLFTGAVIIYCLMPSKDVVKKYVFGNSILIFIGKISYGVYLYHNFIPLYWKGFIHMLDQRSLKVPFVNMWIPAGYENMFLLSQSALLLLLISYLSYRFIESPILKLKSRFSSH